MKTASKKPKPTPSEPSADATPRFKRLVAEGRKGRPKPPTHDDPPPAAPSAVLPPEETTTATEPAFLPSGPETAPGEAAFSTLEDLGATWIEYLKANDAAASTWASYQHDFETAAAHFGPTTDPATLTTEAVAAYEASPAVMTTKKGRPKSKPTILKTRRVLRLALTWAKDAGRLAAIPYAPKAAP